LIKKEEVDRCVEYLSSTDDVFAHAKTLVEGIKRQEKTVLAIHILSSPCKTQGMKEASALSSAEYSRWRKKHTDAMLDFELLKNKRSTASLLIDLYRTELSARKMGMII